MKHSFKHFMILMTLHLILCMSKIEATSTQFDFNFSEGTQKWQGLFVDYPVGEAAFFELEWGWSNLPTELTLPNGQVLSKGIFLSGDNRSDDLFMSIKHQVGGLKPNTTYDLIFDVLIENDVAPSQAGIGGSPGESVYFKVGASKKQPRRVVDAAGYYRLNVDKGNQGEGGGNAIVVGDLANPLVNPEDPTFEPKQFTNEGNPLRMRTDDKGRLWFFVGTDSGFEGSTLYYIAAISVSAKLVR